MPFGSFSGGSGGSGDSWVPVKCSKYYDFLLFSRFGTFSYILWIVVNFLVLLGRQKENGLCDAFGRPLGSFRAAVGSLGPPLVGLWGFHWMSFSLPC